MNDGLREAIDEAMGPGWHNLGDRAERGVRAWLSLPPSEEEEYAATVAILRTGITSNHEVACELAVAALAAALAVRPPEAEKGTR